MTPKLIQLLMLFVLLVGLKSLKVVMSRKEDIVYDLLILGSAIVLLFKYFLAIPFLG